MDKNKKLRFVVQKHYARNTHYDFRLEMDGVLRSWAIPKEVPREEGVKRLAIQVDDHELNYMDFEGEIPEGNYGAGKVEIWDKGDYVPESVNEKKIVFILEGKKLKGKYVLVHTKDRNWIIFRKKED